MNTNFSYNPEFIPENKKIKYNALTIDNFFINPDLIRKFALSLKTSSDSTGAWPGRRSDNLFLLDREFGISFILKALSAYYDLKYHQISWEESAVYFQFIPPYDKKKNSIKNTGWVHQDFKSTLAGIVYLTPDADPDSGTSLYNLIDEKNFTTFNVNTAKHLLYTGKKISEKEYETAIKKHNSKFIEKSRFANMYNRLVMYDANEYHKANNFHCGKSDRLTLVFFIAKINSECTPISRVVNKENFDSRLESRIKNL